MGANGTTIYKWRKCSKYKLAPQQEYVPVDENGESDEEAIERIVEKAT